MKLTLSTLTSIVFLPSILMSNIAQGHGWVEFPSARQNTCYNDGGLWNNSIPNQACQAAYDVSGAYPFTQRNEVAANVTNFNHLESVKAIVSDGSLCAAGDSEKAGLDITSQYWQKTAVSLDDNNQFELVFTATAPHNPSFWEFYLTNENYDPSTPLTWNDLTLIDTAGNISVNNSKQYKINVTVPEGRTGDAILYTRWQRDDSAGEGFYNCSDITFNDNGEPTEPTDPDEPIENPLVALDYFISTDFSGVEVGDTVRLRTFNKKGDETTDIQQVITDANLNTWPAVLAGQFNESKEGKWYIGIWSEEMQHYMFDSQNINANKVFAQSANPSYQLSLIKDSDDPENSDTWNIDNVYVVGDTVTYQQCNWEAQWWTQGEEPGTTGEWGVWRTADTNCSESDGPSDNEGEDDSTNYAHDTIYQQGDVVTYQNCTWQAHWWTQGEEPGTTGEWGVWRNDDENCTG
ncbi:lytic polysaccharide monooxygenase [Shewanella surugensis]|uniref:Lytic polysaccharide monooxygenase n=1 Tax=Shewanella surugensis TaxID=212020 RepID=A0ABT0LG17_9GAMM|nr:lytic polysaccharide monooxygenase [Shewanella surugensis]MCL1126613.1 lytic polysaccharide monooxygenase [Shewanella surugensis]